MGSRPQKKVHSLPIREIQEDSKSKRFVYGKSCYNRHYKTYHNLSHLDNILMILLTKMDFSLKTIHSLMTGQMQTRMKSHEIQLKVTVRAARREGIHI